MENFAKTHDIFWQKIINKNPVEIEHSTGVLYDKENKVFKVKVIDETYLVNLTERTIYSQQSLQVEPEFEVKVIIVTYLASQQDAALSGEWVSEQLLPSGNLFFRGLHSLSGEKIITAYDGNIERLRDRCVQLNGREIESSGDLGIEFSLLPKFPVRMVYWKKDEEFPAHVSFFFDKYADRFLYLDGILAIVKLLVRKLRK